MHSTTHTQQITTQDSALSAAGRFGRFSYLAWNCLIALLMIPVFLVLTLLFPGLMNIDPAGGISLTPLVLGALIYLGVLYLMFIFTIRRLHDRNHTGWLSLLMLVPVANLLLMLYLFFAPGDQRVNSYGPPRATAGWEAALAWIYIILLVLLFAFAIFGAVLA
ncbi:DUF805 domain-containing protein [Acinetobacter indicus]|uniref:DUF805 domain-containing protein n=1 Tax=Acinetobacter indicus TaxID=756892 RepID=UPI001444901C|nr:DUF805 domain-containing protein [Acinetobacter indicus]